MLGDDEGKYSANKNDKNFLKKANPELRHQVKQVALAIPYGAKSSKIAAIMGFKKTIQKKDTGKWEEIPNFEKGVEWRDKYLNHLP